MWYCGKSVNSDAGTARNGTVMRYYKCSGKRIDKSCPLAPIRKEILEDLVVQTLIEALKTTQDIHKLVDKVFELSKEKLRENADLNLLTKEYTKTEKAINNILDCMGQGISTESTKQRLVDLENKKTLLNEQILLTKTKTQMQLNKEDVYNYIFTAIRKKPLQMIDLLVKEIRLYNDRIEIQFNYTDRRSPDENTRRGFCIYTCTKTYTTDTHTFNSLPVSHNVEIYLYI